MNEKPKILWLIDVVGWAYHNRARAISAKLDNYDHVVLSVSKMLKVVFWQKIAAIKPDVIVLMHPSGFQAFDDLGNIVFTATGTRAMESGI